MAHSDTFSILHTMDTKPSPTCLGVGDNGDYIGLVEPRSLVVGYYSDELIGRSIEQHIRVIWKGEGLDDILKCGDYLHQSLLKKPFGGVVGLIPGLSLFGSEGNRLAGAGFWIFPRRALISTAGASLVARLVLAPPSRARRCLRW